MKQQAAIRHHTARFSRPPHAPSAPDGESPPWGAGTFQLDRVRAFRAASASIQDAVLAACAHNLLAEAWCIEQRGIAYCSAMELQSESNAERELFTRIGADEIQHAAWLAPWLLRPPETDLFNRFIDGLLEAGTPQPLSFLLQVVLEGFGITHYQSLAAGCCDQALALTLRRLAIDEALHHAGGLLVFQPDRLTAAERRFIIDGACAFLQMIRVGPQAVVSALAQQVGVTSVRDLTGVFAALDSQSIASAKLARLHKLMAQPGMTWLVEALDAGGVFVPCTPAQCAKQFLS
jgi:hypothetical protein